MRDVMKIIMVVLVVIVILLIITHSAGFAEATGAVSKAALSETDVLAGYVPSGQTANTGGLGTTAQEKAKK
jgi:ABC-type cobalt transport system substrate-binding protein